MLFDPHLNGGTPGFAASAANGSSPSTCAAANAITGCTCFTGVAFFE
jgi:hypothetical protein